MAELGECPTVSELVAALFDSDDDVVEEAQFALERHGAKAVPAVLGVIHSLGVFGQRCALDFISACDDRELCRIRDPSVAEVVSPLLEKDDRVVREWAARILGWLRAFDAIPALLRAQSAAKEAHIPLDCSEHDAYRSALTSLGHRRARVPTVVQELAQTRLSVGESLASWAAEDLKTIIEALADDGQVILSFELWATDPSPPAATTRFRWSESPNFNLGLAGPWHEVVEKSRRAAVAAAENVKPPKYAVVTAKWVDESDR